MTTEGVRRTQLHGDKFSVVRVQWLTVVVGVLDGTPEDNEIEPENEEEDSDLVRKSNRKVRQHSETASYTVAVLKLWRETCLSYAQVGPRWKLMPMHST